VHYKSAYDKDDDDDDVNDRSINTENSAENTCTHCAMPTCCCNCFITKQS